MTPPLVASSLRVFTLPTPPKDSAPSSPPPPVEHAIVIDFETTIDLAQRLTFGSARWYQLTRTSTGTVEAEVCGEWLLYADDLPKRDPDGYRTLRAYGRRERVEVWRLGAWLKSVLLRAITAGWYVAGYNLPFDLSRIAWQWGAARRGVRGFALNMWDGYRDPETGRMQQSLYRPYARVRQLGPHSRSIEWTNPPLGEHRPTGGLLDVSQLVFALTDRRHSLRSACEAFGCSIGKGDPGQHGLITVDYIEYNRRDVAATGELLAAALTELETRWPGLHPTRAYTPASLGRSALESFGLPPTRQRWPDWPVELNGQAMVAYFGGRAEDRIRKTPVPVLVCDYLSQYPTVCALLGVWPLLTSKEIRAVDCAGWLRSFLKRVAHDGPAVVLDPAVWPAMVGFARVVCDGDVAVPVRAAYSERCDGPVDHRTAVSVLASDEPCVYSIPDLVASVLLTGRVPEIVSSWRLEGDERLDGMVPLDVEGIGRIDPYRDDPYVRWIELRKRIASDPSVPSHERDRLTRALKIVANATAYGLLVQCTLKDGERGDLVVATGDSVEQRHVPEVEQFGDYAFPPLGALITAGGRLLLAIAERLVTDLGGTFAFCDTDSMAIVATPNGGPIPCQGGPARMPDGEDAVMALSHAQVMDVVGAFDRLNPYDPDVVGGSILEVESYCRADGTRPIGASNPPRSVTCYAISSKRYVLYREDEAGERQLVKPTEHGLGRYLVPETDDDRRPVDRDVWYRSVWRWALARDLDGDETLAPWADRIAASKLPIQTPHSLRLLDGYNGTVDPDERIRPYGFAMVATVPGIGETMYVAPFTDDPDQWDRVPWYRRDDAKHPVYLIPAEGLMRSWHSRLDWQDERRAKTYAQVLREWADNPEPKLAGPDGEPCQAKTVGLLHRRHVRTSAETTWYRGRGNLSADDDFDAAEGARAIIYRDPTFDLVRRAVEAIGTDAFAELAKAKPNTVRRFVSGKTLKPSVVRRFVRAAHIEAMRETGMTRVDRLKVINAFLEARLTHSGFTCRGCGDSIEWSGRGRRPKWCGDACRKSVERARPDPVASTVPPAVTLVQQRRAEMDYRLERIRTAYSLRETARGDEATSHLPRGIPGLRL